MTCAKVAIKGPDLKKLAQKKIKLAKVVAKEKKILARTLAAKKKKKKKKTLRTAENLTPAET